MMVISNNIIYTLWFSYFCFNRVPTTTRGVFVFCLQRGRKRKPFSQGIREMRTALGRLQAGQMASARVRRRTGFVRAVTVHGRGALRVAGKVHRAYARPIR